MMNKKLRSVIAAFLAVAGLAFVFTTKVHAEDSVEKVEPIKMDEDAQKKIDREEGREQAVENRCERVTKKIDSKLEDYNKNHERYIKSFYNIRTSVRNMVQRLEAKGYDVTEVKANLETLNTMIKEFSTKYGSFIGKLENTKQYACGNSEGKFSDELDGALDDLKAAREKAKEIHAFIRDTLRPSIVALKEQKAANADGNTGGNTDSASDSTENAVAQ